MKSKGFTLIELLVVIAIIGILSAVVLASLDSARNKATDASARADLDSARAQSELYYDSKSNSYLSVCTTATGGSPGGIMDMMNAAASAEGGVYTQGLTTVPASGASPVVACHDSATTWVAVTPLKNAVGGVSFWCVDNTGTSTPGTIAGSALACP